MSAPAPSWDFPRAIFGIYLVAAVAEEHGVPAARTLAGTGLRSDDLARSDLTIAAPVELTAIRNVVHALDDAPGLGVAVGARVTLGMAGVWAFAMLNSSNTREAIDVAQRYGFGRFSFLFGRPSVQERGAEVCIVQDDAELPADLRAFLVERDLAGYLALIPQICGPDARVRVETKLSVARARCLGARFAHHEVIAGCGRDQLVLPAALADRRLPLADPYALERWKQQCDALIAQPRHATPAASGVRAAVLRDPRHPPNLDEVAAGLHVSPRTLRRQLGDERTSFRAVRDGVRQALAEELLAAGAPVTKVAGDLGYADTATFIRAFKRWTGQTPGAVAARRGRVV
jgi:AraC-like DNA-binding protein